MGSVNLVPIDISEDNFEVEGGIKFDPSKLDFDNSKKEKMTEVVLSFEKSSRSFKRKHHKKR